MSSQFLETVIPRARAESDARRQSWRWVLVLVAAGDALCIAGGFALAYVLRFMSDWHIFYDGDLRIGFYTTLTILLIPGWLGIFMLYKLYDRGHIFGGTEEYARLFNACTLGLVIVMVSTFLLPDLIIARAWLLLAWGLTVVLVGVWRFGARRIAYHLRRNGKLLQHVIILGANGEGRAVAEQLIASPEAGVQILGFIDDHLDPGTMVLPGAPILGPSAAFQVIVEQEGADSVIIADTALVRERLASIYGAIDALRQLDVCLAPGLFELLTIGVQVREQGSVPLLTLNKSRITGLHAVGKGLIDRCGAFLALLLLSPVLLIVAVLVRLDSPGPIVYRRRVVGVGNKTFDAFKFRTMHIDGETLLTAEQRQELSEQGKLKDDPRVTRVGRLLRRTSIDELPQLINVLRGQMSLVGPRMITAGELRHFGRWRHNLVTVRPGLTGLWQISGRSNLGYEDRVRLDMHYIRNYSIWLDLYIIYRTIAVVLTGRGAF
ncbi:MAG: sugar transferase [Chloroflexales bacterium]|nr:sugar transferase [Chloroflexales bacterium]